MSSKKKHRKKNFKPKASTAEPRQTPVTALPSEAVIAAIPAPATPDMPQLQLIRHDVRRVVVIAGVFVLLQVILWYLFNNTGLGAAVYRLIQL